MKAVLLRLGVSLFILAAASVAAADDIAYWNFSNNASGYGTNVGKLLVSTGVEAHFWSGIGEPYGQQAFSNNGWDSTSDNWSVDVNTTSFTSINVSSKHYAYHINSAIKYFYLVAMCVMVCAWKRQMHGNSVKTYSMLCASK